VGMRAINVNYDANVLIHGQQRGGRGADTPYDGYKITLSTHYAHKLTLGEKKSFAAVGRQAGDTHGSWRLTQVLLGIDRQA
jgi:hypothetical protein